LGGNHNEINAVASRSSNLMCICPYEICASFYMGGVPVQSLGCGRFFNRCVDVVRNTADSSMVMRSTRLPNLSRHARRSQSNSEGEPERNVAL